MDTETSSVASLEKKLSFSTAFELENALRDVSTRSVAANLIPDSFTSLTDPVVLSDSLLNTLTAEERAEVASSGESYYDLLEFNRYLPNERLAGLLNSRGKVIVADTLYQVTPYGVFLTPSENEHKLDSVVAYLRDNDIQFEYADEKKHLSDNVYLINTFDFSPQQQEDETVAASRAMTTRSITEQIPFSAFPTFNYKSKTLVGKALGAIFGNRSVKHHEFMSKRRVSGSLYDYDYGFYYEIGCYVELERKRGGWLSKINGWKSITAEELVIAYQGLVIEIDYNFPPIKYSNNSIIGGFRNPFIDERGKSRNYYVDRYLKFNYITEEPLLTIDVLAKDITYNDVLRLRDHLAKGAFNALKSELGSDDIDPKIRAIRLLSSNKSYYIVKDATLQQKNTHKMRKVFNSDIRILLGYSSKGLLPSLLQTAGAYKDMQAKKLIAGKVQLAAKHNGTWGGMTIEVK